MPAVRFSTTSTSASRIRSVTSRNIFLSRLGPPVSGSRTWQWTTAAPAFAASIADAAICAGLRDAGIHITIETAGTVFPDDWAAIACDLLSLSPKPLALREGVVQGPAGALGRPATRAITDADGRLRLLWNRPLDVRPVDRARSAQAAPADGTGPVRVTAEGGGARVRGLPGVEAEAGGWLRLETTIGRHPADRKKMAAGVSNGRRAVTRVRTDAAAGPPTKPVAARVTCRLETGRTHQIRVHLAWLGHPLIGDPVYGRPQPVADGAVSEPARAALAAFSRQALHAGVRGFVHPVTGEALRFVSPPPPDFADLAGSLGL